MNWSNNIHYPLQTHSLQDVSKLPYQSPYQNIITPLQFPQFSSSSPFFTPIHHHQRFPNSSNGFVSPLRLIQSPNIRESDHSNLFELQLKNEEYFRLDSGAHVEEEGKKLEEFENDDGDDFELFDQQNQLECQYPQPSCIKKLGDYSYRQLIQNIVNNLGINDREIQYKKKELQESAEPILLNIYEMLLKKFRKLRKTKEEMTKYCIRKAFRYLSQKLRKEDLAQGLKESRDSMDYYFNKFQNDKSFTIPFKKNSVQKTMNSTFLSKIFSCTLFVQDYKQYLRTFKNQARKDNQKKINGLSRIIDKSILNKNVKKVQNFKRLPWTSLIIDKTYQLATSFLQYASSNVIQQKSITPLLKQPTPNVICHIPVISKPPPFLVVKKQQYTKQQLKIKKNNIEKKQMILKQKSCNKNGKKMKIKKLIMLTPPIRPSSTPKIMLLDYKLVNNEGRY